MHREVIAKLLADAVAAGFTLDCNFDGTRDYTGHNVELALDALANCEEMILTLWSGQRRIATALINPQGEPNRQIAGYSGKWIDTWWEDNVR